MSRPADRTLVARERARLANTLDRCASVAEAAAYLGVSRSRIVQLADNYDRGRAGLPSVRTPGGHRLFLLADLEHRLATTRQETRP